MESKREKAQKLYLLGIDFLSHRCDVDALSCLHQSFQMQEHPKTAQMISQILYQQGQHTAAFAYLEKAYTIGKTNDNIAFCYAEQLMQQGKTVQAQDILRAILLRNHSYKKAHTLLESSTNAAST